MTEKQIEKIVIEEIDILSNYTASEIKALYNPPGQDPKLNKFFSASLKSIFAPNLKRRIKFIKTTDLTNELFVTIKTVNQVVKAILGYQKPTNLNLFLAVILTSICFTASAQDRIFSFGYTKNFVNSDSSNISLTIDLNRIPGKTESGGAYYLVNDVLCGKLNYYIKPTADVNLGSYTTLAANNIAIGLPVGISRQLSTNNGQGVWWGNIEIGPDFIADKTFENYLYYVSVGPTFNYSLTSKKETVIDIGFGWKYGAGERLQNVKTKRTNEYHKYIIPLGVGISAFKSKDDKFHHLKFSGIYKYNKILKDDVVATPVNDRHYTQLKMDIYIFSQLGINFTYTSGYEEPLFKKVNSLAFGLSLARKG